MNFSPLVSELIEPLRGLPGVGPRSAQRMTFALLQRDRGAARRVPALQPFRSLDESPEQPPP